MRRGLKKFVAIASALVMTVGMSAMVLAAGEPIELNGDKAGASAAEGTWTNKSDAYLYMGFATFEGKGEDGLNPDASYKYLTFEYTGDIENMRFQFVAFDEAGTATIDDNFFWLNSEHEFTDDEKTSGLQHTVKNADGNGFTAADLQGGKIVIDLEASGVDLAKFHQGMHMHIDGLKTSGDVTISKAWLSTTPDVSGASDSGSSDSGATEQAQAADNNSGNTAAASGSTASKAGTSKSTTSNAPKTGSATLPIALGFAGCAVAVVAFGATRFMKKKED